MQELAKTPNPPYYAVIFTSLRSDTDNDYQNTAHQMFELAAQQPGYLGVDSVREDHTGITVSYWDSLEAIQNWREHSEHLVAQARGRREWYRNYSVRICKVERQYDFAKQP